jgi:membrane protease YdiL (CAAX protease family)
MTSPGDQPDSEPYTGPPPMQRPESWHPVYVSPPVPLWGPAPPQWRPPGAPPMRVQAPAPSVLRWEPPPGTPPHDEPQPYLRAMRSRSWTWWRPLAGLALLLAVYLVAAVAVVLVAVVTGVTPDLALLDLIDPATLLVTNFSLILFIPCVWLAWAVAHGMRIGWSSSVLARLRWRLLLPYTLMALVTLGVGIGLSIGVGAALTGSVTGPVPGLGWLLLVVFLTTPLQSAAEEYLFRGYLSQTIAGWFHAHRAGAVTAAVVTGAVFSLAHAPGDVWTFLDRFVFALAASATVWFTGGLEAAIVLHAVNNVLVFTLAGALGEGVATAEVPQGAGLLFVLVTVVSMGAYVALVARSAARLRPEVRTVAQDLRTPSAYPGAPPPWPLLHAPAG